MKKITSFVFLLTIIFVPSVNAQVELYQNRVDQANKPIWSNQAIEGTKIYSILSRFRYYREFKRIGGSIPQTVEVKLAQIDQSQFALVEDATVSLQPYEITTNRQTTPYAVSVVGSSGKEIETAPMFDGDVDTFSQFPLVPGGVSEVILQFTYEKPISSEEFALQLSQYGDLPSTISIKTIEQGGEELVLSKKQFSSNSQQFLYPSGMQFPKRSASVWQVTLEYAQPLRIYEASFVEDLQNIPAERYIRFLMRPGSSYLLFSQPDGYVTVPYIEPGNFYIDKVVPASLPPELPNPLYKPADDDKDGVVDSVDNCPSVANKDQKDENKNGLGDACEDFDKDGLVNGLDNCPNHPNRSQQDTDADKKGDHCDSEESRITERLAFLPWLGIALGFGVVIALFAITVKKPVSLTPQDKNKH